MHFNYKNTYIKQEQKELWLVFGAFFAIYIIWGSTYMANKVVVKELPPFLLAGLRFCIAAILVFCISLFTGTTLKTGKTELKNAAIAGFFFLSFGNGLAVWALQYIDSAVAAIIIAAQPLVILLMLRIKEKKRIKIRSLFGISLGIIGIYLLVSQKELSAGGEQWKGMIALIFCLLSWGFGSIFVGNARLPQNQFINGAYQMIFGGGILILFSFIYGEDYHIITNISQHALLAMLYLIIFGSIIAFTSFNFLLARISPEKVSTSTYVNPIVAMACGWFFLDEVITPISILATMILLTGVYFINSVRFSKK